MCCPGFSQRVRVLELVMSEWEIILVNEEVNSDIPAHRGYACGVFIFLFKVGVAVFAY